MSDLESYRAKRDLEATPEPGVQVPGGRVGPLMFCLQKHAATNLHYDLRLELDGTLKSWAVPKGPSLDPADKRLAVLVEDHPFLYVAFEDVIPEGSYGAGEMILWDTGFYTPDEGGVLSLHDRDEANARLRAEFEAGKMSFTFLGQKMKGSWTLVRTQQNWLLIKHHDRFVSATRDLLALDRSVLSGLTIEELGRGVASSRSPWPPDVACPAPIPTPFRPMLCEPIHKPFSDPRWIFEPKLDGVRAVAFLDGGSTRILSRNKLELTSRFPDVVAALEGQPSRRMVLDGELIGFGPDGRPRIHLLQQRLGVQREIDVRLAMAQTPVVYFVFDILWFEGIDCRSLPLSQRKMILDAVIFPNPGVQLVHRIPGEGETAFEACVAAGFEGIVAKQLTGRYESDRRSTSWRKLKAVTTADLAVCGFTRSATGRKGFSALVLGASDDAGGLRYVGNVGSGFDDTTLASLAATLETLATDRCPFATIPDTTDPATWVTPTLVAEIKYESYTATGMLRSPVFLGIRPDVTVDDVIRGQAVDPEEPGPLPDSGTQVSRKLIDIRRILEQLDAPKANLTLEVGQHRVDLTNLEKVYWPESADAPRFTKRDLIRYYAQIGDTMLPHLRDRPLTMIRFPEGIHGQRFFQKHWDQSLPPYVEIVTLFSESNSLNQPYVMANNLPTLLWLGQLATIECHVGAARIDPNPDGSHLGTTFTDSSANIDASALNFPDYVSFDLDPYTYSGQEKPGEEPELNRAAFAQALKVADVLKALLESLGLKTYVKTSGKTGLHIFVPIVRNLDFDVVRALCGTLCGFVVRQLPHDATTEWQVDRRTGKVFLDFNMNVRAKTLAAAFSPRALPGGAVSTPVTWLELPHIYPSDFTLTTVPDRVARGGDPWSDILSHKGDLRKVLDALA